MKVRYVSVIHGAVLGSDYVGYFYDRVPSEEDRVSFSLLNVI